MFLGDDVKVTWKHGDDSYETLSFGIGDDPSYRLLDWVSMERCFTDEWTEYFNFLEKQKGWELLGQGRHRTVFTHRNANCVIKLAHSFKGVEANLYELVSAQRRLKISYKYPWTHIEVSIPVPHVLGHARIGLMSVLCVEYVKRCESVEAYRMARNNPIEYNWITHVDADNWGPQVGWTEDERLVCFDWSPF